jgi:hypothetical protein
MSIFQELKDIARQLDMASAAKYGSQAGSHRWQRLLYERNEIWKNAINQGVNPKLERPFSSDEERGYWISLLK